MNIDIEQLKQFLKNSVEHTYAGDGKELTPQRPGFIELEYKEGDWYLRDSYTGWFQAPGMSVVYYQDKPAWTMSYGGKVHKEYYDITEKIFEFLKTALMQKDFKEAENLPIRGPSEYEDGDWKYTFEFEGDMKCFYAREKIFYKGKEISFQDVIGGLVIDK